MIPCGLAVRRSLLVVYEDLRIDGGRLYEFDRPDTVPELLARAVGRSLSLLRPCSAGKV